MQLYLYVLHIARPGARDQFNEHELAAMSAHFAYLERLTNEGTVLLAGPTQTKVYGIVVLRAESEQEALRIMQHDPSVAEGVMGAELHPFSVALLNPDIANLLQHTKADE